MIERKRFYEKKERKPDFFYNKMRRKQDLSKKMRRRGKTDLLTESWWLVCPLEILYDSYFTNHSSEFSFFDKSMYSSTLAGL